MLMITTSVRLDQSVRMIVAYSIAEETLTWSTGFMATPRVLGHELRLTANLCLAREASASQSVCVRKIVNDQIDHILNNGLSVRPPPATMPIIPLALLLMTFFAPLGSLTLVFPSSGL